MVRLLPPGQCDGNGIVNVGMDSPFPRFATVTIEGNDDRKVSLHDDRFSTTLIPDVAVATEAVLF